MRVDNVADPVYYPNSFDDAPAADEVTLRRGCRLGGRRRDGAGRLHALHAEDDDFGQANTLVNEVMDDAARDRLVDTVSGLLAGLRRDEVLPARLRVLAQHRQDRRRPHRRRHRAQTDPLNPTAAGRRAPQALPRVCCAITEAEIAAGKPA